MYHEFEVEDQSDDALKTGWFVEMGYKFSGDKEYFAQNEQFFVAVSDATNDSRKFGIRFEREPTGDTDQQRVRIIGYVSKPKREYIYDNWHIGYLPEKTAKRIIKYTNPTENLFGKIKRIFVDEDNEEQPITFEVDILAPERR